jgi:hypothetical protein
MKNFQKIALLALGLLVAQPTFTQGTTLMHFTNAIENGDVAAVARHLQNKRLTQEELRYAVVMSQSKSNELASQTMSLKQMNADQGLISTNEKMQENQNRITDIIKPQIK